MPAVKIEFAMSIGVPYMGTKHELARLVAYLISDCKDGPLLDAFAGMCAVGTAVAPSRAIWANDILLFARLVGDTYFRTQELPPDPATISERSRNRYVSNVFRCNSTFAEPLMREKRAIEEGDLGMLADLFQEGMKFGQSNVEHSAKHKSYDLFASRFSGTYFAYHQTIDIDSIRFAIQMLYDQEAISLDGFNWLLVALGIAMSRCTTATGHFAQPLMPKMANQKKFVAQRKRSLWREWLSAVSRLSPLGSMSWRRQNRSFNDDAVALLKRLKDIPLRPGVIYADPPYTKDQYSRYYHLYETLVLYDYPNATGRGLYRPGRAVSCFSMKRTVEEAIDNLIAAAAALRADLVFSYPKNGLMDDSDQRIPHLISRHYHKLPEVYTFNHTHSTLGASKGTAKAKVVEIIYRVRCNA